ncbi:MAG: hypothetical protein ACN6OP_09870 [Pseudomonadales bacterium]
MTTVDTHRWAHGYQDVLTFKHGMQVRAFLRDVVEPSLAALDTDIAAWAASNEGGAPFAHADAQALLQSTVEAFCLAIQSLWERQLRSYLRGCVTFPPGDLVLLNRIAKDAWPQVQRHFESLRGIPMTAFDSFAVLDLLQLIGNACRHGDGPSSKTLFREHPLPNPGPNLAGGSAATLVQQRGHPARVASPLCGRCGLVLGGH